MKRKRYFNTSGPNIPEEHYTLPRESLINKGIQLVQNKRYFTIWAPRQTGKSTYFRLLAHGLEKMGYKTAHINLENYRDATIQNLFNYLFRIIKEKWDITLDCRNFEDLQNSLESLKEGKCVLIIDEIEGLNPALFGQFLHTIRNLYHSRENHCLKSVILVGVSNILGVVQDNASPFNIADNLDIDYFSRKEVFELLDQHESETGQLFAEKVKEKIYSITAGQPGLVNGFAYRLQAKHAGFSAITYDDYLETEDWYLTEAIDKNVANVINKAMDYRPFVESLLFAEKKIPYRIDREAVKVLYTNGLFKKDKEGNVAFRVPLYKKRLYEAFYPYTNGEKDRIIQNLAPAEYIEKENHLNFDKLIGYYKDYVKRRSFNYFREKDSATGQYKSIKEAALIYSFETFIQAFLQEAEGKSYMEAHTGAGRSDLIINVEDREYVIEAKIYSSPGRFAKGKKQLAYYCKSLSLTEGIYLVFTPDTVQMERLNIKEETEIIEGVTVRVYLIIYNLEKDF